MRMENGICVTLKSGVWNIIILYLNNKCNVLKEDRKQFKEVEYRCGKKIFLNNPGKS